MTGGTLFSELGFYYIGPIDGHDVDYLVQILENVKKSKHEGPILIHAITQKEKVTNLQRTLEINIMEFQNLTFLQVNKVNQNLMCLLIQKYSQKL